MTRPKSYVISVSGGKDSTALALHMLRELRLQDDHRVRVVTFDTGWEHPATYAYIRALDGYLPDGLTVETRARFPARWTDQLEAAAVRIEAMLDLDNNGTARRSPMVRWILSRGMFPSRVRRFCTQELKVFTARDVMQEEIAAGYAPINAVGVRAAESAARAKLPEYELSTQMDAMVWRPLIGWSEAQVIAISRAYGVPPNPLYLDGAGRVGCWPCIQAGKKELRLLGRDDRRIEAIRMLEETVTDLARLRHVQRTISRPANDDADTFRELTFFQNPSKTTRNDVPRIPIDRMLEWAKTARGKNEPDPRLDDVMAEDAQAGCMRWGMCDLPEDDGVTR